MAKTKKPTKKPKAKAKKPTRTSRWYVDRLGWAAWDFALRYYDDAGNWEAWQEKLLRTIRRLLKEARRG